MLTPWLFFFLINIFTSFISINSLEAAKTDEQVPVVSGGSHEKPSLSQAIVTEKEKDGEISSAGIEYFKKKLLESKGIMRKKASIPLRDLQKIDDKVPFLDLTLQEVIEDVVFYNPSVEQVRLQWLASLHTSKAVWGEYEPALVAEFNHNDLKRENTTLETLQQGGNRNFIEKNNEYKVGVEGKILSGAIYNVGYSLTEEENNLALSDETQSFAGVSLTQPLLKGVWFGSPLSEIKIAKIDRHIAFHNFRTRLMRILYETEAAYWNLSFAQEKYTVAGESVGIAQKLVKDSQERLRTGKMSKLNLLEAEAGLADRLGIQADARQELLESINQLKLLLSSDKIDKKSGIRTATAMYEPSLEKDIKSNFIFEEILNVQPDYLVKRYELKKEKLILKFQKDQSLPELNFKGSYGYSSIGETKNEAWEKLKDRDHRVWSVGAELRVPLLAGIEERHLLAAERLKKQTAEENLKAVEYEIASSLQTLRRRVKSFRKRIKNARRVVSYRSRLLDVELVRLSAGKSNTRVIFETEEDLAEAKQLELESLVRYREAIIQYALLSGSLLRDKGLEIMRGSRAILSEALLRPIQ